MNMQPKISSRDWESLSAYLDGELSAKERSQIELRLRDDPELRSALKGLRQTRIVLRSQPRLRAPRNFTLSPQMAGLQVTRRTRSAPFAFPALRLAAALATIFFVMVMVGDLASRSMQPTTIALAPQNAPFVSGMGGGMEGNSNSSEGVELPMQDASVSSEAMATGDVSSSGEMMVERSAVRVTPVAVTPLAATAEAAFNPAPQSPNVPPAGAAAKSASGEAEAVSQPSAETPKQSSILAGRLLLRVLQVAFAIIAICAGIGAWLVKRSARY